MGQTALSDGLRGVEAEIAAGRLDQALALCQELLARFPRALAVQRVLGEVYLAQRKTREALGALDRALAGNPEDARACCARAIVQQIQGNSIAALEWYRRACDLTPDDYVLRSAYRELASHLNQPAYQPTRMGLARLYLRGDLFPHAIREWEALLAEQPDALEAQVGLAETFWRAHRLDAAESQCRHLLLNAPSCLKALLILLAIEHAAGHTDEAQRLVQRTAELDPDQRMAQVLFADQFAAGDAPGLRALVLGDAAAATAAPLASRTRPDLAAPVGASRAPAFPPRASVPQLPDQPTEQMPSIESMLGPRGAPAKPSQPFAARATAVSNGYGTEPLPGSITGGPSLGAPSTRAAGLPADFHTIFAETEYMLWGRDEDGRLLNEAPGAPTGFDRSRADQAAFSRSSIIMPPALRDQGASLDETEARAAINWVNWLQAQGARPHEVLMPTRPLTAPLTLLQTAPGVPGTPGARAPLAQAPNGTPAADASAPHMEWSSHTGPLPMNGASAGALRTPTRDQLPPLPTVPAPAGPAAVPSSEALRAMFAELEPDAGSRRVPSGNGVPSVADLAASLRAPLLPRPSQPSDAQAADAARSGRASAFGNGAFEDADDHEPQHADAHTPFDAASLENYRETFAPFADAPEPRSAAAPASLTIEQLERTLAQPGFESIELRPGQVATLAQGAAGSTPAGEQRPEPSDYAGRLGWARARRGDGKLDDALTEYRQILRNAPDLLGEVIGDLHESMEQSPEHPEIHRLLGDAHIRQGDYLSALESYNRAVALTQAQGGAEPEH